MWRGLMLTKAVEQFLRDVRWGELDDLLIDMPPGTGDVQMGLARLLPRADMVIVTTPALAAQKVAQRAADMARRSFVRVVGVIENMIDVHVRARHRARPVRRRRRRRPRRRRSAPRCSAGPARTGGVGRRRRRPPGDPRTRRQSGRRGLRPDRHRPRRRDPAPARRAPTTCPAARRACWPPSTPPSRPTARRVSAGSSRYPRHLVTLRLERRSGHSPSRYREGQMGDQIRVRGAGRPRSA